MSLSYSDILIITIKSVGIVASLLNIYVFAHQSIRKSSYIFKYLLTTSIVDLMYLSTLMVYYCLYKSCGGSSTLCGPAIQFVSLLLVIGIRNYFASCMMVFNICIELLLGIQRAFSFTTRSSPWTRLPAKRVISLNMAFALLLYLPLLFDTYIASESIKLGDNNTVYEHRLVFTSFGVSLAGKIIPIVISVIRQLLCGPILTTVSLINLFLLRKYIKRKESVSSSSQRDRKSSYKLSIMIAATSLIYIVGNLPYLIYYATDHFTLSNPTEFLHFFEWFSRFCLVMLIVGKTGVYFVFNSLYRQQAVRLFHCRD